MDYSSKGRWENGGLWIRYERTTDPHFPPNTKFVVCYDPPNFATTKTLQAFHLQFDAERFIDANREKYLEWFAMDVANWDQWALDRLKELWSY